MSVPPELMALLQHGGGGGAPPGAGPPPAPDGPEVGNEHEPIAILQQMISLANKYLQVEPDAEDKATMATKVLATLHQYLAKDQQDAEAALGGGSATRVLRKLG